MSERLEQLRELAEQLRDPYWWADRPITQAALAALVGGLIGLTFKAIEIYLEGATSGPPRR